VGQHGARRGCHRSASVVQAAMRSIRMKISEGQLSEEPWYARLDEEARKQYRESAQPLFQGLMRYIAPAARTDGQAGGEAEARAVAMSMPGVRSVPGCTLPRRRGRSCSSATRW